MGRRMKSARPLVAGGHDDEGAEPRGGRIEGRLPTARNDDSQLH
jgi:hypothetical protein